MSYSNEFSSIYRAAHGAVLSTAIQLNDAGGADPLPKSLGNAYLSFTTAQLISRTEQRAHNAEDYDSLCGFQGTGSEHNSSVPVEEMSIFDDLCMFQEGEEVSARTGTC